MGFLPVVVGIEDSTGARADAKRADGTRSAIVLQASGAFTTGYEFDGGLTRVFLGAAWMDLSGAGVLTIGGAAPVTSIVLGSASIPVSAPGDADVGGNLDVGGDLTVTGDLTVDGTTTSIKSTILDVADRVIHVNDSEGADDPVPADIAGVAVHRGAVAGVDRDHAGWVWDEAGATWRAAWNTGGDDATVGAPIAIATGTISASTGGVVASTGLVRLPNNTGIYARNAADSGDVVLVRLDGSNNVYVGTNSPGLYLDASTVVELQMGGSGAFSVRNVGAGTLATSGTINLRNQSTIRARNPSNTADVTLVNFDASSNYYLGDVTSVVAAYVDAYAGGRVVARLGATERFAVTGSDATGTIASSGTIRIASGSTFYVRNAAASSDLGWLSFDGSDNMTLGAVGAARVANVHVDATTAIYLDTAGTNRAFITSGVMQLGVSALRFSSAMTPLIEQQITSAGGATGVAMSGHAQDVSGIDVSQGGSLTWRGGDATNAGAYANVGGAATFKGGTASGAGASVGGNATLQAGAGTTNGEAIMADGGGTGRVLVAGDGDVQIRGAANVTVQCAGGNVIYCDATQMSVYKASINFAASVPSPVFSQNVEATGNGEAMTVSAQDASQAAAVTAGSMTVRGGNATGGSSSANVGGSLNLLGGTASGGGASVGGNVVAQPGSGTTKGSVYLKDGAGTIRVTVDPTGYVQLNGAANYLQSTTWAPDNSPVDGAIGTNSVIASQVFS